MAEFFNTLALSIFLGGFLVGITYFLFKGMIKESKEFKKEISVIAKAVLDAKTKEELQNCLNDLKEVSKKAFGNVQYAQIQMVKELIVLKNAEL